MEKFKSDISIDKVTQYLELLEQKKYIDEKLNDFKKDVENEMRQNNAKNGMLYGLVKVSLSPDTETLVKELDYDAFEKNDPALCQRVFDLFGVEKVKKRKGTLRITRIDE